MSATANTPNPSLEKAHLRLWLRMLASTRRVENELRERFRREFETTLPRFDVLATLYHWDGGLKMSDLSRALMVSNGNVTGLVERLVQDGLLLRVPVPGDRRATLVRLTTRGKEAFLEMAAAHEGWVNDIMSTIPPETAEDMVNQLDKLRTEEETL